MLLMKHKRVFAKNKTDLGRTDVVKRKINTGTAAPVKQNPRHLPFSKRELVREEISKMLEQGIVPPSQFWFDFCFTALRHILGHFGRGQLT